MTAAPSFYLPEELRYLLDSATYLPAADVASLALPHLERLSDSNQKADIGRQLIVNLSEGDENSAGEAAKALQVMEKFPHYPRPRAAVAIAFLKSLLGSKAA